MFIRQRLTTETRNRQKHIERDPFALEVRSQEVNLFHKSTAPHWGTTTEIWNILRYTLCKKMKRF